MRLPPPVIHSSKLMSFAKNDDKVKFTDRISLYVGDAGGELVRLGEMPNIAICNPYYDTSELLVFLCDEEWEPKGTLVGVSLDDAKKMVERGYEGIHAKWVDNPYSNEEIEKFLLDEYGVNPKTCWWEDVCSFCGKKDVEVERMLKKRQATICGDCITEFYEYIKSSDA